jgi:tetratricopeptide (TPR) repeat protein
MDSNQHSLPDPMDADDYFGEGIDYQAAENYEKSIAAFNQAILLNPTNAKYHYHRATTHFIASEWSDAIADYTIALKLKPDPSDDDNWNFTIEEAYNHRAIAYRYQGNHEASLSDYAELIRRQPNNPSYYFERSIVHKIKGDFENSFADVYMYQRLAPNDSQPLMLLGDLYQRQGNEAAAMASYSEAAEKYGVPSAYFIRGELWKQRGNLVQAIADFEAAIKLYPRYYEIYLTLGESYLAHGDFTQAIDILNSVMQGREDFRSSALVLRAKTYLALGNPEQAGKDFDEAISVSTDLVAKYPGYTPAYVARGLAYAAQGHVSEAVANFQKALTLFPTLSEADMMREYISIHS